MFKRRTFILGILSCTTILTTSKLFNSKKAWGNSDNLTALIARAEENTFDGFYSQAIELYKKAIPLATSPEEKLLIVNHLTRALILEERQLLYKASIAKEYDRPTAVLFNERAKQLRSEAIELANSAYEKSLLIYNKHDSTKTDSLDLAFNPQIAIVAAWLNLQMLLLSNKQKEETAIDIVRNLPVSSNKTYQTIQVANSIPRLQKQLLETAIEEAKKINDLHNLSLALGFLGKTYQQQKNYKKAIELTQEALSFAYLSPMLENRYRWHWQMAELYLVNNQNNLADLEYQQAIEIVELLKEKGLIPFKQKEKLIELYQNFLQLILSDTDRSDLNKILKTSDRLQAIKLERYFNQKCVSINYSEQTMSQTLNQAKAVLLRLIVLTRQSYLIAVFPSGNWKKIEIDLSREELKEIVKNYYRTLIFPNSAEYEDIAKSLYKKLIYPLETELEEEFALDRETPKLIFIGDDFTNNIPISTLIDPKTNKYLIENYIIINSLASNFKLDISQQKKLNLLAFGLVDGTYYLPYVADELESIAQTVNSIETYLNEEFNTKNLQRSLEENEGKNTLHIATHGSFNGLAETSYIEASDRKIVIPEFKKFLVQMHEPFSLVVLSACSSAAGSNNSVLGIAGSAFLSGINTCIATYWNVNDDEIYLTMSEFYSNLKQGNSTAEAIRKAQLGQLQKNQHPYYWGSLVLLSSQI